MSEVTGTRYGADVTEWDGITYSVTVDIPTDQAHPDDVEIPELVQMTLSRLVHHVRSGRAAQERRMAEDAEHAALQCPAVHAVRGDDDLVHSVRCTLTIGHAEHHRGDGIAWLTTIDPWAPDLAPAMPF